ncbi:class I SAM-dependent methyltransferase [Peribacillus frigoritolerans]|uniref:class I SAM-dependent methyltransferase n=1 Tax=Peribacillus frigoritolerans TaxID=450367 RepID=UPI00105A5AFD|nr:class I SAM-dependent methyltransferase [Peribacillus frigoritolerans]TDL80404.1 class I SAM-dependent methyltransferase [Peribacillus frigoritolerans]
MKQNIYDDETFFEYYQSHRKTGVTYNDFVEQPAMKAALSDLHGKSILDLGCGTGGFAKYCVVHGASSVLGVDLSEKMLKQAIFENSHEKIEYVCSSIEDFEAEDDSFDVIISSLAFHYIEDFTELIKKISRWLKPGGKLVFSVEHPVVTARLEMNNWVIDKDKNKLHWAFDNYQEEGIRQQEWVIKGVIKYHRTLSTIVNSVIKEGLVLEELREPQSMPIGLERLPKLVNEKRRPSFLIVQAGK